LLGLSRDLNGRRLCRVLDVMARYYLRLPPDTALGGEWDNFRVLGRDAENVDQVRREIAQAFGRDDPPDGFEIIQGD